MSTKTVTISRARALELAERAEQQGRHDLASEIYLRLAMTCDSHAGKAAGLFLACVAGGRAREQQLVGAEA